jgi:hypothetical protein
VRTALERHALRDPRNGVGAQQINIQVFDALVAAAERTLFPALSGPLPPETAALMQDLRAALETDPEMGGGRAAEFLASAFVLRGVLPAITELHPARSDEEAALRCLTAAMQKATTRTLFHAGSGNAPLNPVVERWQARGSVYCGVLRTFGP